MNTVLYGGKMAKNRSRKDKQLKEYSLRKLVTEITGVKLFSIEEQMAETSEKKIENRESEFEAAYQEVKRICAAWKKFLNNKGPLTITDKNVKGFIFLTRAMYFEGRARVQYDKLRKNERLTDAEHNELIDIFVDAHALDNGWDDEEKLAFRKKITLLDADDCWEIAKELRDIVTKDLQDVNDLQSYELKKALLDEYRKRIQDGMQDWRNTLAGAKIVERIISK